MDWVTKAREVAEQHVLDCIEAEEMLTDGHPVESPASEDFDGSVKDIVREALVAAWPVIEESIREGDFQRRQDSMLRAHDHVVAVTKAGRGQP